MCRSKIHNHDWLTCLTFEAMRISVSVVVPSVFRTMQFEDILKLHTEIIAYWAKDNIGFLFRPIVVLFALKTKNKPSTVTSSLMGSSCFGPGVNSLCLVAAKVWPTTLGHVTFSLSAHIAF